MSASKRLAHLSSRKSTPKGTLQMTPQTNQEHAWKNHAVTPIATIDRTRQADKNEDEKAKGLASLPQKTQPHKGTAQCVSCPRAKPHPAPTSLSVDGLTGALCVGRTNPGHKEGRSHVHCRPGQRALAPTRLPPASRFHPSFPPPPPPHTVPCQTASSPIPVDAFVVLGAQAHDLFPQQLHLVIDVHDGQ